MLPFRTVPGPDGRPHLQVPLRGTSLLGHPLLNKGTAFSHEERSVFGLEGLLPDVVTPLELQARRAYEHVERKESPLEKYIGMASLQDRNEYLYYRVLIDHLEEMMPIVYTPTVGEACKSFSHIFRRSRGLYITPRHRGQIAAILDNAPFDDVRLIVVTDNERILGLGDQGAGGMGIPVGKLALYTAAAGIHPARTLPISLDVGTDNAELLADPLYVGYRHKRLRGAEYDSLVDEFVQAVKKRFPRALLQWEDFKKGNSFRLLDRYRNVLPSFNDDIQGTAAVAVAGVMGAARVSGIPLTKQRILVLGAGAAGVGIAHLLRTALEKAGLSGLALTQAIGVLDSSGFLVDDRAVDDSYKRAFCWPAALAAQHGLGPDQPRDLLSAIKALSPTVLIGTSGQPGIFTEELVREMASRVERPVIFPMSNPTSLSEARPSDLIAWTDGRALIATGSPFAPVQHAGKLHDIGQGNNVYVFPGLGLGALVAEAEVVTDRMFAAAAEQLAAEVSPEHLERGRLFPPVSELRNVTRKIAKSVVQEARSAGLGRPLSDEQIDAELSAMIWSPEYLPYMPA